MNAAVCVKRALQGYSDCERGSVTRKIRDFVVTAIALIVLFAMLLSINPDLRERVSRMVTDGQVSGVPSTISYMTASAVALREGFRRRQHVSLYVSGGGVRLLRVDAEGHLVSVILVVQPDPLQGKILHDVAHRIGAELVLVDSTKRAVEAIARTIPDLILLSVLLSPREEDKLMARLRSLEGASHLQTLTLPEFRSGDGERAQAPQVGLRFPTKAEGNSSSRLRSGGIRRGNRRASRTGARNSHSTGPAGDDEEQSSRRRLSRWLRLPVSTRLSPNRSSSSSSLPRSCLYQNRSQKHGHRSCRPSSHRSSINRSIRDGTPASRAVDS